MEKDDHYRYPARQLVRRQEKKKQPKKKSYLQETAKLEKFHLCSKSIGRHTLLYQRQTYFIATPQ